MLRRRGAIAGSEGEPAPWPAMFPYCAETFLSAADAPP